MQYNICNYGADPTGVNSSTVAINHAIDDCAQNGGGYVDVPAGSYVCGSIDLADHVYLHLHPGATLFGSDNIEDYHGTARGCSWRNAEQALEGRYTKNDCLALIIADRKTNCGIIGAGVIDGRRSTQHGYSKEKGRPFLIVFSECKHAILQGVTLKNAGMFTFYGLNSCDVTIEGVTIRTQDSPNGDGLDFDGGKRICISNCNIDAGDDAIGLKTLTPEEPCEDFTITGCHLRSKHWGAVRIGPESAGAMRRILIANCCFYDCGDGLKFQLTQNADFEDIQVSNITMVDVLRPIFFTKNSYNMSAHEPSLRPDRGAFRRVTLSNITATMRHDSVFPNMTVYAGNFISALPGETIDDITLDNVHIIAPGGGSKEESARTSGHADMYDFWTMYPEHLENLGQYPSAVLYLRHAAAVRMRNCTFETQTPDQRAAVAAECVRQLSLTDCRAKGCHGLLRQHQCPKLTLRDNDGDIFSFTKDQVEVWESDQKCSHYVSQTLESVAKAVQKTVGLPIVYTTDVPLSQQLSDQKEKSKCTGTFRFSAEAMEKLWLVIPRIIGDFSITCNGYSIACMALPSLYQMEIPYAADLSAYLIDGENHITLSLPAEYATHPLRLLLKRQT